MNHIPSDAEELGDSVLRVYFPRMRLCSAYIKEEVHQYVLNRMYYSFQDHVVIEEHEILLSVTLALLRLCTCHTMQPLSRVLKLVGAWCHDHTDIPWTCDNVILSLEYMQYECDRVVPSLEQLHQFADRRARHHEQPDEYEAEERVCVEFKDITLHGIECKDATMETCTFCQESMLPNQLLFRLQCGHMFHARGEECLTNMSITDWLRTHRRCPNCNTDVHNQSASVRDV